MGNLDRRFEGVRPELLHTGRSIGAVIQRQRRPVFGIAVAVGVFGVFFIQVCTVREQYLAQVERRGCAVDLSCEPVCREARKISGMIDMGMGQNDGIDAGRVDREGLPVAQAQLFVTLE